MSKYRMNFIHKVIVERWLQRPPSNNLFGFQPGCCMILPMVPCNVPGGDHCSDRLIRMHRWLWFEKLEWIHSKHKSKYPLTIEIQNLCSSDTFSKCTKCYSPYAPIRCCINVYCIVMRPTTVFHQINRFTVVYINHDNALQNCTLQSSFT